MKLSFILLTLVLVHAFARSGAQSVTLSGKNLPLKMIFAEVKKQTGYVVLTTSELLSGTHPVSLNEKQAPLPAFMATVLAGQPLQFSISGKTILLTRQVQVPFTVPVRPPCGGLVQDAAGRPLPGAFVRVAGSGRRTVTDATGRFIIEAVEGDTLVVSFIGFVTGVRRVGAENDTIVIRLLPARSELEEVVVVNTGYQALPRERATGSFVVVDSALAGRRVSTNVLDRLNGIASGVLFRGEGISGADNAEPAGRNLGLRVRGESTMLGNRDPLLVVDGFPYEGDPRNINPNDVVSITILKDAAAASIWGSRSGNGVIVITTRKGKNNQPLRVTMNANFTTGSKPDVFYDRNFLDAAAYIGIEKLLFGQGYFNADIANTSNRPPLSPVVDILALQRAGLISPAEAETRLGILEKNDVRHDFSRYMYQPSTSQQYAIGLNGGTHNMTYAFSAGYDRSRASLVGNRSDRLTLSARNTYQPVKGLEISLALNYGQNNTYSDNAYPMAHAGIRVGGKYGVLFPYARLADDNGHALPVVKDYNAAYTSAAEGEGFLDWHFRPLDELRLGDNDTRINSLLTRAGISYRFAPFLRAEVQYQNERQKTSSWNYRSIDTYFARDLINRFAQKNTATSTLSYPLPAGGIADIGNSDWNANNLRVQLSYDQSFRQHELTAIAGAEAREIRTQQHSNRLFGYNDELGYAGNNLNYNTTYATNPGGTGMIPVLPGSVNGVINRFVSAYANAAYTYHTRYTLSGSARADGANLFGVKVNNKITPLWSAGAAWDIAGEKFYAAKWLPSLKLRFTYGYNGNVYNATAYTTGVYITSDLTGAPMLINLTAPNPELRWEKVKNINLGIDFATSRHVISGTLEFFQKYGEDLVEPVPIAPSAGFRQFIGNAANTKTQGIDLTLNSRNLNGAFKWYTTLLASTLRDKVTRYDPVSTAAGILGQQISGVVNKPLYSIFSHKWAGLDPANGNPQGYLNGKVSTDYTGIMNNYKTDSLQFHGSAVPELFGSLRNDFAFRNFSLSVNIIYKLNYYFRRGSTPLNYADVLLNEGNVDYAKRWQQPGDERHTSVPSLVYPSSSARNNFYRYAEVLVENAGHIRLQDVRLGYDLTRQLWKRMPFPKMQLYAYANNIGILWRANKYGIDPDVNSQPSGHILPVPFSIAFGIQTGF